MVKIDKFEIILPLLSRLLLDMIGMAIDKNYNFISYLAFSITMLLAYRYTKNLKGEERYE